MKNLNFLVIVFIIFLSFLSIFTFFSISISESPKDLGIILFSSNKTKEKEAEVKRAEETVQKIKNAYNQKLYEKTIDLLKELPSDFSLTPEENLIISESFLRSGFPERASEFSEKVISVKKGTHEACLANLINIKANIIRGEYKIAKKDLKDFLDSYCDEGLKKEAKILLYFIKELPAEEIKKLDKNLIIKNLGEIYKLRGLYFIKKGELKRAEDDFFTFINVYGTYKEAPELIYQLAEAYFKKDEEKAKTFYELIITNWDGTKEALFSKFRLYQIAYEKSLIKELLPEKTKEDLISFATLIKSKYPEEKIAEEASFMIFKVSFEDKNYFSARKGAIEFLKTYEKSPFIDIVKTYYCKSVSSLFEENYEKKNLSLVIKLEVEDKDLFEKTKCGEAYYTLGDIYFNYNLYTKASYCFIRAYELNNREELIPKTLLKLGLLALEDKNLDLFNDIFNFLDKSKYKDSIKDPYYFYLKAFYEGQKDLGSSEYYLNLVLNSTLSEKFKEKLLKYFRDRALYLRQYSKALVYTNNPFFKAKADDYVLLLLETFNTDKVVFENTLKYAKEKFPDNLKIKWLEAYSLEKKGNIKASTEMWKELTKESSLESELAKSYEKMRNFVERTHQTVF